MKFKNVQIKEILDSPPTNSGLKKKDVFFKNDKGGLLPVYSASKDETAIFGWLPKNSKWKKYKNVLTWNKDGSAGIVFYRNNEFIPYEKVKILKIKTAYHGLLDYEYLRKVIELSLLSEGFNFGYKCSMERVLGMYVSIPMNGKGEYDIEKQKILVEKYKKIDDLKKDLKKTYEDFIKLDVEFKIKGKFKEFKIEELFEIKKGNAKYTRKYIINNSGEFPVFSSQTINDGIIGYINTYDFDTECLTWTTDGVYAGTIFYRNCKFNMSTHCGALILKKEYTHLIDLNYIYFYLKGNLKNYTVGDINKRLTVDLIKPVILEIPVNDRGEISLEKQKNIAKKYHLLRLIKLETSNKLLDVEKLSFTFQ